MRIQQSIKYLMIALYALSLIPVGAQAAIFLNQTNTVAQNGCTGDLDLNTAAGAQTEVFFAGGGPVQILLTGECAVDLSPNSWIALQIFIDPAPVTAGPAGDILVTPTSTDQAFCSGDNVAGTNANGSWVNAASQAAINLPFGVHSIRVQRANPSPTPATACRIDDTSLVIQE